MKLVSEADQSLILQTCDHECETSTCLDNNKLFDDANVEDMTTTMTEGTDLTTRSCIDRQSVEIPRDGAVDHCKSDVKVARSRIVTVSRRGGSPVDQVVSSGEHTWEGWCHQEHIDPRVEMTSTAVQSDGTQVADDDDAKGDGHPSSPVHSQDDETAGDTAISSSRNQGKKTVKSILKKRCALSTNKSKRHITFNDKMTVFSDTFGTSYVAMRSEASIPEDMYTAYEPPPEYQDCLRFEPPDEYKDIGFDPSAIDGDKEGDDANSDDSFHETIIMSTCRLNMPRPKEEIRCDSSDDTVTADSATNEERVNLPSKEESVTVSASTDVPEDPELFGSLLTEENLKQHEQLMKTEILTSKVPTEPVTPPATSQVSKVETKSAEFEELSPPLKQLNVQIASQPPQPGDDWQVELSPLNSVSTQETESDSSLSSQDTIILMTSDEKRRNEEHIKESLKIYEGLKKVDSSSLSSSGSDETKSSAVDSESPSSDSQTTSSSSGTADGMSSDDIRRVIERNAIRRSMLRCTESTRRKQTVPNKPVCQMKKETASLADRIKMLTCVDNDTDSGVDSERSGSDSSSSSSTSFVKKPNLKIEPLSRTECSPRMSSGSSLTNRQRHSLVYHGYISPLEDISRNRYSSHNPIHRSSSEMHVHVPQQLFRTNSANRERHHSGPDQPGEEERLFNRNICDNATINKLGIENNNFNSRLSEGGVDELELFVKQDSDRIDRIRQRYSYSSEADSSIELSPDALVRKPSVRGIRPKFGTTMEILQQMQAQNKPPIYASPKTVANHMTWPYNQQTVSQMTSSHSSSVALKSLPQESQVVPRTIPENIRVRRVIDERGTPEGASSSPKVSSDSLVPSVQKTSGSQQDGVIFYSMNV